jgi:hypothetical protein
MEIVFAACFLYIFHCSVLAFPEYSRDPYFAGYAVDLRDHVLLYVRFQKHCGDILLFRHELIYVQPGFFLFCYVFGGGSKQRAASLRRISPIFYIFVDFCGLLNFRQRRATILDVGTLGLVREM